MFADAYDYLKNNLIKTTSLSSLLSPYTRKGLTGIGKYSHNFDVCKQSKHTNQSQRCSYLFMRVVTSNTEGNRSHTTILPRSH